MIYYGLLLFFLFEYVRPSTFLPGLEALHLNSIIPVGIFLGSLVTRQRSTRLGLPTDRTQQMILLFLGLIGLSVLTADVTFYAYNKLKGVLGYILVFWVITRQVTDMRRVKGLFVTLVVVHLILAASTPQMFLDTAGRYYLASGTFLGDGNDFALSVNLTIPLCLFLLSDAQGARKRLLFGGALLVLVACVVLTKSRGGTVGLVSVALYYWSKSERKLRTGLVACAMAALILLFGPSTYFDRLRTIGDSQESSAQGRLIAWRSAVRMALDNPILGVGAGHFPVKFGTDYRPPGTGSSDMPWLTAHSIYFLTLGELGFVGLGVLLSLIISNLLANRRLVEEVKARSPADTRTATSLLVSLNAGLIAFATNGAFLSATYYPHLFVLSGIFVASRRVVLDGLQACELEPEPSKEHHPPRLSGDSRDARLA